MTLTTTLSQSWRVFFPVDSKESKLIMPLLVTPILFMGLDKGQFWVSDSKEQKLTMPLVVVPKLYMEFHKDQFWIPYFSISVSVAYFDITECDSVSYADDNAWYRFDLNLGSVISNLEKSANSLLIWFRQN